MARQTFYGESLSEASATGTAWVDNASVSFMPDDNSTYFYFQSAALALTNTGNDGKHRFLNTTSGLVFGAINAEAKDATDYVPAFAVGVESFTTGHGAQTLTSQISGEAGTVIAKIREDRIVALKKGGNDDHAVSAGDSTTTSSSYQDKINKNFTPGSAGDYLVIAFCDRRSSATGINTFCCLDIDGSVYGEAGHSVADLNTYRAWGTMVKMNLTAAAHTIKLKFRSNGTATATVNNAVIIILRLSDFVNNYYAEDRARETHSSSTFLTQASITVSSPANQEHVILACAQYDHGGTTTSTSVRLEEAASGTTGITEILEEPVNSATNNVLSWFIAYRKTLAAESHTWNIQHHNESGTIVSGIKDKAIAVLQTGQSGTPVSNQSDLQWNTIGRISRNLDARWNAIQWIAAQQSLQWNLLDTVGQQVDFRWNSADAVSRQAALQWNLIGRVADLLDGRWDIAGKVQQAGDLRWTLRETVSDAITGNWNVRQFAGAQEDVRWNLIQRAAAQLAAQWHDRQLAADTADLRWHINQTLSSVADELELAWSLAGSVAAESDLRWNLRSPAARALDARWHVTDRTAALSDISWALRELTASDPEFQWDIGQTVNAAAELVWHARNAAARQIDVRWQLRAATARELEAGWQVRQLAGAETDLRWALLNQVAEETALLWDDRQEVAAETEIYWQLIGRIAHWLKIYWNTNGAVPETSRSRTLFVKEDSRVAAIPADARILAVPPDNRTATVSPTRTIN